MFELTNTARPTTLLKHCASEDTSSTSVGALMQMISDLRIQLAQAREQETRSRLEYVSLMSRFTHQPTDYTVETFNAIMAEVTSWSTQLADIAQADLNDLIGNEEYKEIIRSKIASAQRKRQDTIDKLSIILTPNRSSAT